MTVLDLYKKSNTYKVLKQDFVKDTLSHTYMLKISDEILAKEYAKFFAMQIYCEDHSLCMNCANCKKVLHDNMGDIKYFPKNNKLSVEESRQIVSESMVMPYESKKKIFIINNFETATPQSQNALLKVLEEPTASNIFLIVAKSDSTVLKTILSRSKKIVESALDYADVVAYIQENYPDLDIKEIANCAELANGNISFAVDLVSNKVFKMLNRDILTVISSLKGSGDVLKMSNILVKYKDNLDEMLDIMLQTFLQIKVAILTKSISARLEGYEDIINSYSPESISLISKLIIECKNRVKFNCSYLAIIDYLLFGILEAKFVCK